MSKKTILVTGATGAQGGAVVAAFLDGGWSVRALVRSPDREDAVELAQRGVEIAKGEFADKQSLVEACQGADAVFSVQPAVAGEIEGAQNLADAAREAEVGTMIHTSVSSTGWRSTVPPEKAHYLNLYWDCKEESERIMRESGFDFCTILKPAFLMENFLLPKSAGMFPDLANQEIVTAVPLDKTFPAVATRDIGAAAYAATIRPAGFNGKEVELAGDASTLADYGRIIGQISGKAVEVQHLPKDKVLARGQPEGWVESQSWSAEFGYTARPDHQREFGLVPTSFEQWAQSHVEGLRKSTKQRSLNRE
jgi:uncharacterized protein YbjT (DUF2867 family)